MLKALTGSRELFGTASIDSTHVKAHRSAGGECGQIAKIRLSHPYCFVSFRASSRPLWSVGRSIQISHSFKPNARTIHFVLKPQQRRPSVMPSHSGSRRAPTCNLIW